MGIFRKRKDMKVINNEMETITIKIPTVYWATLRGRGVIPSKRRGDGCYDIYADPDMADDMIIKPGDIVKLSTDIASAFPEEFRMGVRERGSTGVIGLATRAGQVDSNYRGEWFVIINNTNKKPIIITSRPKEVDKRKYIPYDKNKAICQVALEIVPVVHNETISFEELSAMKTDRGLGCLGSSNK